MTKRKHGGQAQVPEVRTGQPSAQLTREQFEERFRNRFYDPAFEAADEEISRLTQIAWETYHLYRKSPRKQKAGPEFADPEFELAIEWLEARRQIQLAEERHRDPSQPRRILVICGASRSNQTCPGEESKTHRLVKLAEETLQQEGCVVDVLDLSLLASQYGRVIYPCKACVSTAMPLCNWPCSCYPNHAIGQVNDWMNEIYPRWVEAHGVMIVSPVYWHGPPSPLKLMMDRLVCADGGNPDPTTTHGKDPAKAKALELEGWDYPRHLAGRAFAVVVHGDAESAGAVRRGITDWLTDMHLVAAASMDRYIGYYEPYATSHEVLDRDEALQEEVRVTARTLADKVRDLLKHPPGRERPEPRPK